MKKQQTISLFTVKLLLLLVAIAVYVNLVFFPLQKRVRVLDEERANYESVNEQYQFYSSAPQQLRQMTDGFRKQVNNLLLAASPASPDQIPDDVAATAKISGVAIAGLTVDAPASLDKKSASGNTTLYQAGLSISIKGTNAQILAFVSALENLKTSSYLVNEVSSAGGGATLSAVMQYFKTDGAAQ